MSVLGMLSLRSQNHAAIIAPHMETPCLSTPVDHANSQHFLPALQGSHLGSLVLLDPWITWPQPPSDGNCMRDPGETCPDEPSQPTRSRQRIRCCFRSPSYGVAGYATVNNWNAAAKSFTSLCDPELLSQVTYTHCARLCPFLAEAHKEVVLS